MYIDDSVRVENPYETTDQMKAAFLKKEISWNGAWELLCRFFRMWPSDAKRTVDSWEAEASEVLENFVDGFTNHMAEALGDGCEVKRIC
jgi:hypothetical protein